MTSSPSSSSSELLLSQSPPKLLSNKHHQSSSDTNNSEVRRPSAIRASSSSSRAGGGVAAANTSHSNRQPNERLSSHASTAAFTATRPSNVRSALKIKSTVHFDSPSPTLASHNESVQTGVIVLSIVLLVALVVVSSSSWNGILANSSRRCSS